MQPLPLNRSEVLYLPPLRGPRVSRSSKKWRILPLIPDSEFEFLNSRNIRTRPRFLHNTKSMTTINNSKHPGAPPFGDGKNSTQIEPKRGESLGALRSEEVEQLIWGTDKAFEVVAKALADAKSSAEGWHSRRSQIREDKRGVLSVQKGADSTPNISNAGCGTSSEPTAMVEKPKERDIADSIRGQRNALCEDHPKLRSRLATGEVTANDADKFGRRFSSLEPDDFSIRTLRHIDTQRRKSMDSIRSIESMVFTPTDPFHLEGLSHRIQAAQQGLPPHPAPDYPPPARPTSCRGSQANRQKGWKYKRKKGEGKEKAIALPSDANMVFNEHVFPSPPRKHRKRPSLSKGPDLPTISETSALEFPTGRTAIGNFETFQSTAFSWTSPLFLHGPIRIERADVNEYSILSPQDESLDWTAFQMAILGTMDENGGDQRDDWEFEADERERDAVVKWWDGFGFEGFGEMQGPPPLPPKELQPHRKFEKSILPVDQTWRENNNFIEPRPTEQACHPPRSRPRLETTLFHGHGHDKTAINEETGETVIPPLPDSLPPSPMLDLAVSSPLTGNEEDMIPMGFNLGHDLGDFLSWEARYMQTL